MNRTQKWLTSLLLFLACAGIHWCSLDEERVENYYSQGFSPWFSSTLRVSLGWIHFSIGDMLYGFLVLWIFYAFSKNLFLLFAGKYPWRTWLQAAKWYRIFNFIVITYLVFNIFWGLNYSRKGIAHQIGLNLGDYGKTELLALNHILVEKANNSKSYLVENGVAYPETKMLFQRAQQLYAHAATEYPFLKYKPASIKTSLWGWVGNYTGFTGYYNPFTGEAQVNTTVPPFLQPFICAHEIAHQLGYAKEREANFVGYLAIASSSDTLFQYSAYLDLFMYANRQLYGEDSSLARQCRKQLSTDVQADIKEWITFNNRHKSYAEPLVRWAYGLYLQGNQQPQGLHSYDEVTAFLISYYKKYNKL
jgi:hypothetical protein